jgi:hypothetical protein
MLHYLIHTCIAHVRTCLFRIFCTYDTYAYIYIHIQRHTHIYIYMYMNIYVYWRHIFMSLRDKHHRHKGPGCEAFRCRLQTVLSRTWAWAAYVCFHCLSWRFSFFLDYDKKC